MGVSAIQMSYRQSSIEALVLLIALVLPLRVQMASQTKPTIEPGSATTRLATSWMPARTEWGEPDLQGIWSNGTITPLERPDAFQGRQQLTNEEKADLDRAADTLDGSRPTNAIADLEQAYNAVWWDRGRSIGRTSLIIDPQDGRLPPLTAEGQRRRAARAGAQHTRGPADSVEDRPYQERCLLYHAVPPMPTGYNNNYQIVQTPGSVAIVYEMLHEVRLIPLDGRPHGTIRQWMGDSRGHWEGDALVVETTNFIDKIDAFRYANTSDAGSFLVASDTLRVLERFRRVSADNIEYQFTIDDQTIYTRPWTATLPMTRTRGPIYEYACHEGNYSLEFVLRGQRAQEERVTK